MVAVRKGLSVAREYPTLFGCAAGAGADIVCVGVPYDRGTPPEHAGCAAAPQVLRRLSAPEITNIKTGELFDLQKCKTLFPGEVVSDLGDLRYRPSQADEDFLEFISQAISVIAGEGKRPLVLGGDHLVTLSVLRGLSRAGRRFQLVQLDAHHDYEEVEPGDQPTHATFVSYIAAERLAEKVIQVGVRGLSWGAPPIPGSVDTVALANLADALLPGTDVYLSVDTDAFDPSVAPAVHHPEPGGLSFDDLTQVLATFRASGLRGMGADWTEYSPNLDTPNHITGRFVLNGVARMIEYLADPWRT